MVRKNDKRIQAGIVRALHTRLLGWYRRNKRDLPWRRTRDPYAILVSEIMLQQTRVAAVIPYYERWMCAFPTVESLARAKPDDVLTRWAGLGYYSRARNLHRAAVVIVKQHGGKVPREPEKLMALPGIGRYTAGAIASIAFNEPAPILDGNVIRVLSRLFCVRGDTSRSSVRKRLWQLAAAIVPASNTSDFNQALMELGALVCVPDDPRCPACPLRRVCLANARGEAGRLPRLRVRKVTQSVTNYALLLRRRGLVWLEQRQPGELMAGLWCFPRVSSLRGVRQHFPNGGARPVGSVTHFVMHRRITVKAFLASSKNGSPPCANRAARWVPLDRLRSLALPSADRRLAQFLTAS